MHIYIICIIYIRCLHRTQDDANMRFRKLVLNITIHCYCNVTNI